MKVFDLHCDTIIELCASGEHLINHTRQLSIDRACFESYVQTFAVFMPDQYRGQAAIDYFNRNLHYFKSQMQRYSELIEQAYTGGDLTRILQNGKIAAILSVEGGSVLAGDLSYVPYLKQQGVSLLTLTWNGENELGSGTVANSHLTDFGRDAVAALEQNGIIVDASHLSDNGFDDLLEIVSKPFVATHSNARAVCDVPRNLRDDQFQEIVKRQGLVGINFYPNFLCKQDKENAGFKDILCHVEHFLALGGEDALALGSDFDGASMPADLNSVEKIANLYEFMLQSISDKKLVDKMFFDNAYRFYQKHLG